MSGQNTLGLLDGLNDHIAISLHLRHKECEVRTGWRIEGPDSQGHGPLGWRAGGGGRADHLVPVRATRRIFEIFPTGVGSLLQALQ